MSSYSDHVAAIQQQQEADRKKRQQDLQARLDATKQQKPAAPNFWDDPLGNVVKGTQDVVGSIAHNGEELAKGLVDSVVGTAVRTVDNIGSIVDTSQKQAAVEDIIKTTNAANKQARADFDAGKITQAQLQQITQQSVAAVDAASKTARTSLNKSNSIDNVKAAGDAAQTALNLATLGGEGLVVGGIKTGLAPASEDIATSIAKSALTAGPNSLIRRSLADAMLGAGYGAATTASTEGRDIKAGDVAANAALGGVVGGAIPVVGKVAEKTIVPAVGKVLQTIREDPNPQGGFLRLPGGKNEPAPTDPVTPAPDAPQQPQQPDLPIQDRINPHRTNPAGIPESLPTGDTPSAPIVDGAGNPAFVQGKANPAVFGDSSGHINIAKDNYISAVKSGNQDAMDTARQELLDTPVNDNANVAKTDLIKRIDSFADQKLSGKPIDSAATNVDSAGVPPPTSDGVVPPSQDAGGAGAQDLYTSKEQANTRFFNRDEQLKKTESVHGTWLEKTDQALFDKNAPLQAYGQEYTQRTGKKLAAEDDPHALRQLVNGAPEAALEGLRGVFNDMHYIKKANLSDELMRYGVAKQVVSDRAKDYPAEVVNEMQGTINRIESELSPEELTQLEAARRNVVDYHNEQLLRMKDEGVLSNEWYDNIKQNNSEYFTGFNFADHVSGNERRFATNSGNNAQAPIQSVKGLDDAGKFNIEDPTTAIPRQAIKLETQLANHKVIDAINRYQDAFPDSNISVRLNTPEEIDARIDLNMQNKGLRPIREGLKRAITRDAKTARKLETVINNLNKEGMNTSLKNGGDRMAADAVPTLDGVGGKVPTSKAGIDGNPSKLGTQDTGRFFKNLIETNSRKEIDQLIKKIGTKDAKLTGMLEELGRVRSEFDDVATQIKANRQEALNNADRDVPDGYEAIETWQDGKKIRTAVLQPIADALKGKNDIQVGTIENFFGKTSKPFRASATVFSPGFAPFMGIKDFGQWILTSENLPIAQRALVLPAAYKYAKGLFHATFNTDLAKLATSAGAGGSNTLAQSTDSLIKDSAKNFGRAPVSSTKDMFHQAMSIISKPARAYAKLATNINRAVEYAPKLAEFQAALDKGKSVTGAAVDARAAVADMQNAGVVGRVLNNFVPFANATLQGTGKLVKYAHANPKTFTALAATTVALPAVTAYTWNTTMFPDVWDNIDQNVKDTDFIIILSDNKDDNGNYTDVIKIPKTDAAKVIAAPIEAGLQAVRGKDHDSITALLLKTLGFTTPISIEKNGKFDPAQALNATPPLLKVPFELATNKDIYTGNAITPDNLQGLNAEDQVKKSTPGIDKFISSATGGAVNPLEAGVIRKGFSANLGSTDPGTQLTKRFAGAQGGAHQQQFYELVGQVQDDRAKASNAVNKALASGDLAAAQDIVSRYNQKFRGIMDPWVKEYGSTANADMKDTFTGLRLNLTSSSVKARLKSIAKKNASN